ncbi:hypothetical protein [Aurantimonas sp. Leaf443]|uniref:hypothetical protein n=1 Tax=Aurantimonas sp. Leaf443 TaxID=1736378 RepID=UPI0007001194|nr:hypothetical protein [Aurantimonas sp. Leaf443]KQT83173.1 hypothetical protein ASG48_14505 [Aurantimonas sp. Leaf443]
MILRPEVELIFEAEAAARAARRMLIDGDRTRSEIERFAVGNLLSDAIAQLTAARERVLAEAPGRGPASPGEA